MATTRRTKSRKLPDASEICEALDADQETVIREVLSRVTDKWSLWALSELKSDGPLRFSRLLERVEGVSQKSLTATLRGLERTGLVRRTVTVQVPIRVDYEATPLGHELIANFQPFWSLGCWQDRPGHGASQVMSDTDCRARSEMIVKLNHVVNNLF